MYTKKQKDQYNHDRDIVCDRLGITIKQYNMFRRYGQQLKQIYEDSCNGIIEETEYIYQVDMITRFTDKHAKELGLKIFYQTDPRGATIYLSHDKIEDNNYNRVGSECVY